MRKMAMMKRTRERKRKKSLSQKMRNPRRRKLLQNQKRKLLLIVIQAPDQSIVREGVRMMKKRFQVMVAEVIMNRMNPLKWEEVPKARKRFPGGTVMMEAVVKSGEVRRRRDQREKRKRIVAMKMTVTTKSQKQRRLEREAAMVTQLQSN